VVCTSVKLLFSTFERKKVKNKTNANESVIFIVVCVHPESLCAHRCFISSITPLTRKISTHTHGNRSTEAKWWSVEVQFKIIRIKTTK